LLVKGYFSYKKLENTLVTPLSTRGPACAGRVDCGLVAQYFDFDF